MADDETEELIRVLTDATRACPTPVILGCMSVLADELARRLPG